MSTGRYNELAIESQVDVTAIARIVDELFSRHRYNHREDAWLLDRTAAARLGEHETDALRDLDTRLREGRPALCQLAENIGW